MLGFFFFFFFFAILNMVPSNFLHWKVTDFYILILHSASWLNCLSVIDFSNDFLSFFFFRIKYHLLIMTILLPTFQVHAYFFVWLHGSELVDHCSMIMGFPGGSDDIESQGDLGSNPGLGRSPREGNGNPLQYSCLENPRDRGAWRATVHGVAESQTWLSGWA